MATAGQAAEAKMTTVDQAALKAAGDKYNEAKARGDTAAMEAAHKEAENIRAGYGYSGGTNGAGYIPTPAKDDATGSGAGGSRRVSSGNGGGNNTPAPTGNTPAPTGNTPAPTGNTPTPTGTSTYVLRNGQRVPAQIINGKTYDMNGNPFSFQNGDYVATQGGYYLWNNGSASNNLSASQMEEILSVLGRTNGYDPKGNDLQVSLQQELEAYLKQYDPDQYYEYLKNGINWNLADAFGDNAGKQASHRAEENLRGEYGVKGGSDGTLTEVINPENIPEPLVAAFQPLIDEYNAKLIAAGETPLSTGDYMSMLMNGFPVYNAASTSAAPDAQLKLQKMADFPDFVAAKLTASPEGQLAMANLGQYPEFIRAIYKAAPQSNLSLNFSMAFPEYTVGEDVEKLNPLGYQAKYMPEYWERFQNEYDPERFASDYDAIRDQLIAANQAGVDLGRQKLQYELENALPEYDELRRQNAITQAKAANNTALYNAAQGDLGGIGSRRYSTEQNAYDQRMNEIQLEQQNLINTTNQQIAMLEAEGKMKEAEILAEWAQTKLAAMQEQYNQYWNLYQQGSAAMENLEYGIASDEWDRLYKIRQDEINEQLNKYNADVQAYNAGLDLAKAKLDVDVANRDYNYQIVKDQNDYNMKMAQLENDFNQNRAQYGLQQAQLQYQIDKANLDNAFARWEFENNFNLQQASERNTYNSRLADYGLDVAKLQADVDKYNMDYDYNKWLDTTNLAIQQANDAYDREVERFKIEQDLKQRAFDNAMEKLNNGFVTSNDISALGLTKEQAEAYATAINSLRATDVESAKLQLELLQAQIDNLNGKNSGSGGSGGGSGYRYSSGGGGGDDSGGGDIFDQLFGAGVEPIRAYAKLLEMGYGVTAAKQLSDAYSALYPDLQKAAGIDPETGKYLAVPYKGDATGAVNVALDMLGRNNGNANGNADSPSLETLLWGLNNDRLMQTILGKKGAPYSSPGDGVGGSADGIGSANYKGKK